MKSSPGVYSGDLYRTKGPAFNAQPFNPANVNQTKVGSMTFTFADRNSANFAYSVSSVGPDVITRAKMITREVLVSPGTTCQ